MTLSYLSAPETCCCWAEALLELSVNPSSQAAMPWQLCERRQEGQSLGKCQGHVAQAVLG